ncbi:uncharacterized protein WCC33_013272 [Rhinophrynus dorsalis]
MFGLGVLHPVSPCQGCRSPPGLDSFLQGLASLKICVLGNETWEAPSLTQAGSPHIASQVHSGDVGNTSVMTSLKLDLGDSITMNTALQISVTARQLGLKGRGANDNMTVTVFPVSNMESMAVHGSNSSFSNYCITITGPKSLLPQSRSSLQCPLRSPSAQMSPVLKVVGQESEAPPVRYRIMYNSTSALKSMISQEDRSLCSKRLIVASLTFFVMGCVLCLINTSCLQSPQDQKFQGIL